MLLLVHNLPDWYAYLSQTVSQTAQLTALIKFLKKHGKIIKSLNANANTKI